MPPVATTPRLPGVYFLPPLRPAGLGLPPLDVAAFVGFAERGPLHLPVPVEDLHQYQAVFGEDLPLASEPGGRMLYANLPRAVAGFFDNGGRRCYVVRVAGQDAKSSRLRIPGLVALGGHEGAKLASTYASSEGRWSEQLRLATRLRMTPLPVTAFSVAGPQRLLWMTQSAPQAIQAGDLLRLTFADGRQWLFPVTEVERRPPATPATPLMLVAEHAWQLIGALPTSPPLVVERAIRLTLDGDGPTVGVGDLFSDEEGMQWLELVGDDVDQVRRGDVLRLELSDGSTHVFPIAVLAPIAAVTSPPTPRRAVAKAERMLRLPDQPLPAVALPFRRVERLRFDLLLRQGEKHRPSLSELAFNMGHPRFWGDIALLESSPLYRQSSADADGERAAHAARLFRELQRHTRSEEARNGHLDTVALAGLLAPLGDPQSPDLRLATPGEERMAYTYVPVGMLAVLTGDDDFTGPVEGGGDGLNRFDPSLFVDDYLVRDPLRASTAESARTLMATASDRYYLQNTRLRGLHSLLFIDEVALIAVPDAVHREWQLAVAESPPIPVSTDTSPPSAPAPDRSGFVDCAPPPIFEPPPPPSQPSSTKPQLPVLEPPENFDSVPLLAIHHALITMCQARGDAMGILTLPLHFEKRQCIGWQEDLRQRLGLPRRRSVFDDVRDLADLSYVGVYHPWLLVPDTSAPDQLRAVPCDGAACGTIAARELQRQVWVAPANMPLQGVLGLMPSFTTDDWADLFELQFNLVRPEPRDFRIMSAHTLSEERAWLQVSVRRLIILLRKLVAERGMDFVFESNHERFRDGVRVMLEDRLRFMFEHGAFAGATAEQAFRVVTDNSINTVQSLEQGRFIALIQVAPSQPLEFITVQLTRTGEGLLLATET